MLTDAALLDWIDEDSQLLVAACDGSPEVDVPTCPEWTLDDLAGHVGGFLAGWYPYNLRHDPEHPDPMAAYNSAPPLPDNPTERIKYLRESAASFVDAARNTDLDMPVWAFGPTAPARYWVLRAASEIAVHTWDAQKAIGNDYDLSPERAAQSIDEVLEGIWTRESLLTPLPEAPDAPISILATDSDISWLVTTDKERRVIIERDSPGAQTTAIRGPGQQVVLWTCGRVPTSSLQRTGSVELLDAWNFMPRMGI